MEVAAFRITQEALTNAVDHAAASTCSVRLALDDAIGDSGSGCALRVEICDDGRGLLTDVRPGVGLASMRERAEELGGTFWLGTGPAGGTRVVARMPLAPDELSR